MDRSDRSLAVAIKVATDRTAQLQHFSLKIFNALRVRRLLRADCGRFAKVNACGAAQSYFWCRNLDTLRQNSSREHEHLLNSCVQHIISQNRAVFICLI